MQCSSSCHIQARIVGNQELDHIGMGHKYGIGSHIFAHTPTLDRSHRTLHGALLDAQLLAQVYVELTGGRQIGLGLVSETIEVQTSFAPVAAPATIRPPRLFAASDEELARHAAFMKKVVNPLWANESPG